MKLVHKNQSVLIRIKDGQGETVSEETLSKDEAAKRLRPEDSGCSVRKAVFTIVSLVLKGLIVAFFWIEILVVMILYLIKKTFVRF